MDAPDDIALLRQYTEQNSEAAFATLVSRYVHSVFSAAYRQTGDRHHAEEITQVVFVLLARKAGALGQGVVLSGWLHKTARLTALTWIRSEIRRNRREQEVFMTTEQNPGESDVWDQIAPLLDAAMADLAERDRHTILLRYFDGRSMKEIADTMNTSEDAVKMRVNRAVEKLRRFFRRRGVPLTSGTLTATMASRSVQAAPAGLETKVVQAAVRDSKAAAPASPLAESVLAMIMWHQIRIPLALMLGILLAGIAALAHHLHALPGLLAEWHRRLMP
jgi:RNA polymerase sigma factor (sigma-70 family)